MNAAVLCVQDMLYQWNMLESIGLKVELPMILEMDNKEVFNPVNVFSVGGCTQHIDVKQCFLQELKEAEVLVVKWIPGWANEADIFTKNLDGPLSNTMQSYFLVKEQLVVRGVTLSKGGV